MIRALARRLDRLEEKLCADEADGDALPHIEIGPELVSERVIRILTEDPGRMERLGAWFRRITEENGIAPGDFRAYLRNPDDPKLRAWMEGLGSMMRRAMEAELCED